MFAVNLVQLIVAITSNVFLLLNMTRRVRFSIAQPIIIVGWYLSSILLTIIIAVAYRGLLSDFKDYVWSEAFWYGVWAAILYFVVASLMVITVTGAERGHYPKDFQLNSSQRTLMLQTIIFLIYLLLGALVFCYIEDWAYLEGVYWANTTLFTIGFGDLVPSTNLARALLIPYAFVGVISIGLVISSIMTLALERASRRVDIRVMEKRRQKALRRLKARGQDDILHPIQSPPHPASLPTPPEASSTTTKIPTKDEATQTGADETEVCHHRQAIWEQDARRTEFARREAEFNLMRMIRHDSHSRRRWISLAFSMGPWLLLWLVGAVIFQKFEEPYQNWSYFDGFYFTFVSLMTLGYGDHTPVSNGGRSFFVFWALLALPTMTILISNASDTVIKIIRVTTLELGKKTILPGEHGSEFDVQYILYLISFGHFSKDKFSIYRSRHVKDYHRPLSIFRKKYGEHGEHIQGEKCPHCLGQIGDEATAPEAAPGSSESPSPSPPPTPSSLPQTIPPADPAHYHYRLISAISTVSDDIKNEPGKRYSFAEWVEYLSLIGEDEASPEMHSVPRIHPPPGSKGRVREEEEIIEEEDGDRWSWVGHHSPLMKEVSEGEWILEKLTCKLKEELEAAWESKRREQLEQNAQYEAGDEDVTNEDENDEGEAS